MFYSQEHINPYFAYNTYVKWMRRQKKIKCVNTKKKCENYNNATYINTALTYLKICKYWGGKIDTLFYVPTECIFLSKRQYIYFEKKLALIQILANLPQIYVLYDSELKAIYSIDFYL